MRGNSLCRAMRIAAQLSMLVLAASAQGFLPRGSLQISHFSPDYAQASDEFVVLFNRTADTVDLNGYELRYFTASGSSSSAGRTFLQSRMVAPGAHLLVASRETVVVGSVVRPRDEPFTAGMATSGGQLVLRHASVTDSIVYACAWGTVATYVAGMTDAAPWPGDGMLSLVVQDGAYVRTGPVFSNAEYQHTVSSAIVSIPSLVPPPLPPSSEGWSLAIVVTQGGLSDSSVSVGLRPEATDSFDIAWDIPLPPPPDGEGLWAAIDRPDYGLATGQYLLRDIRGPRGLGDTTVSWSVVVHQAASPDSVVISLVPYGLPSSLPLLVRDGTTGDRADMRSSGFVYRFPSSAAGLRSISISVGDSVAPVPTILAPVGSGSFSVGSSVPVLWHAYDASGIDSAFVQLQVRPGAGWQTVAADEGPGGSAAWSVPERLLTDSARIRVVVRDALGNAGAASTAFLRVVPDTMRRAYASGWHMVTGPFEPLVPSAGAVLQQSGVDPAYLLAWKQGRGYLPADSIVPGRGYFLGLLTARTVTYTGIGHRESVEVRLREGFNLIGPVRRDAISAGSLQFVRSGETRSMVDAVGQGWIAAGLTSYDHFSRTYRSTDSLEPGRAYWLPVLAPGVSMLHLRTAALPGGSRVVATEEGWRMRLIVIAGGFVDSAAEFGLSRSSTEGFDPAFDRPYPPDPPGDTPVAAWFDHPEWSIPTGARFSSDIRPAPGNGWRVTIRANPGMQVVVRWSASGFAAVGRPAMTDLSAGRTVVMHDGASLQLDGGGTRVLLIGMPLSEAVGARELPDSFELGQNHPNPFNASTVVRYALSGAAGVDVRVFDLLGRQVDGWSEGERPAGRYLIGWRPTLPSGVYVLELRARPAEAGRAFSGRIRVVLLR